MDTKTRCMLIILDGYGWRQNADYNAIALASTPHLSALIHQYGFQLLRASGPAVGLPEGYPGNSEAGHLTLGAGRVIEQDITRVLHAMHNNMLETNAVLQTMLSYAQQHTKTVHIIGLMSDGGVHSHIDYIEALIVLCARVPSIRVYIHAITDGRDSAPQSAVHYLQRIDQLCAQYTNCTIASIHGRFYAMDRDNNWERTKKSFDVLSDKNLDGKALIPSDCEAIVSRDMSARHPSDYAKASTDTSIHSTSSNTPDYAKATTGRQGERSELGPQILESVPKNSATSWRSIIEQSYARAITDEFIVPTVIDPAGTMHPHDVCFMANVRPERMRQLLRMLAGDQTIPINYTPIPSLYITTLTQYVPTTSAHVLFEPLVINNTLKELLSAQHKTIFTIAETEKYAHVTYFFNGQKEQPVATETRTLIPSLHEKNYVTHPEMSAHAITTALVNSFTASLADFYLVNYANMDMVGHSGNLAATIQAVE
ncbi:MAG: 2,3-bisphosphoglycerate-independent phosphoglycerate mutase, partial [Candidatus Babeliales bacterium]